MGGAKPFVVGENTSENLIMATHQRHSSSFIPADIVVRDREGRVVLVVEVKAPKMIADPPRPDSRLLEWTSHEPGSSPFIMIANAGYFYSLS